MTSLAHRKSAMAAAVASYTEVRAKSSRGTKRRAGPGESTNGARAKVAKASSTRGLVSPAAAAHTDDDDDDDVDDDDFVDDSEQEELADDVDDVDDDDDDDDDDDEDPTSDNDSEGEESDCDLAPRVRVPVHPDEELVSDLRPPPKEATKKHKEPKPATERGIAAHRAARKKLMRRIRHDEAVTARQTTGDTPHPVAKYPKVSAKRLVSRALVFCNDGDTSVVFHPQTDAVDILVEYALARLRPILEDACARRMGGSGRAFASDKDRIRARMSAVVGGAHIEDAFRLYCAYTRVPGLDALQTYDEVISQLRPVMEAQREKAQLARTHKVRIDLMRAELARVASLGRRGRTTLSTAAAEMHSRRITRVAEYDLEQATRQLARNKQARKNGQTNVQQMITADLPRMEAMVVEMRHGHKTRLELQLIGAESEYQRLREIRNTASAALFALAKESDSESGARYKEAMVATDMRRREARKQKVIVEALEHRLSVLPAQLRKKEASIVSRTQEIARAQTRAPELLQLSRELKAKIREANAVLLCEKAFMSELIADEGEEEETSCSSAPCQDQGTGTKKKKKRTQEQTPSESSGDDEDEDA
jgi:hypothetical protein